MPAHPYKDGCMCDNCIKERVRAKVAARDLEAAGKAYVQRRGAPIGGVSVPEALKNDKR